MAVSELLEEEMMDLVNMTEDEYRMYKKETLRRVARIYQAEGHHMVIFTTEDGFAIMVDQTSGKTTYSKGDD